MVAIPTALAVTLRIPAVQNKICRNVVDMVNASIDGSLEIGSIHFIPFNTIEVGEVRLLEQSGDTLVNSENIFLNINELSALSHTLTINRVKIENTSLGDLNRLIRMFKKEQKDTTKSELPWDGFRVSSLILDSLNFEYDSTYSVSNLHLSLNDVFIGDGFFGTISSLSLKEKGGLEIRNFCTYFLADKNNAILKGLKYKDNWSDINIPILQLKYDGLGSVSHFADSVEVSAEIERSSFGFGSAGPLVKKFRNNPFKIYIDGSINGRLSDFSAKNLTIKTSTGGTNINIAAIVKGLPVPQETQVNLRLNNSYTCAKDILTLIKAFSDTTQIPYFKNVDPSEKMTINCLLSGTFQEMKAKLHFESEELGLLDANVITTNNGVRMVGGEISASNVDVGKVIDSPKIGKISAFAAGWAEFFPDNLRAEVVSAEIDKLDLNGYQYCDISGGGSVNNHHYKGELSSLDTNCFFKLMADFAIDDKATSRFIGNGNFNKIDLAKLNLVKMDTCMTSFLIDFDFSSDAENNLLGELKIQDLMALIGKDFFDIGPVSIRSREKDNYFDISIESSLMTAAYQGTDYLYGMVSDAMSLVTSQLNHIVKPYVSARPIRDGCYGEFNLITGDLSPIASLLPKNIYINSGTNLNFRMDHHKKMDITLSSELVSVEDKFFKDFNLKIHKDEGPVEVALDADMIQFGETAIDRDTLRATIADNTIKLGLFYNDRNQRFGEGTVNTVLTFPDTLTAQEKMIAEILPSQLRINQQKLDIEPGKITIFRNKRVLVDNLKIENGSSYLYMNGAVGHSRQDTVALELNNFNISGLNFLFKKKINLNGICSGRCSAVGFSGKEFSFLADFEGKEIEADGEKLGDIKLLSKWDEKKQQINFLLTNTLGGNKPVNVVGQWAPYEKSLHTQIEIDKFNIGWVDPFLVLVLDHTQGTASGKVTIDGKDGVTKIKSEGLRLNDVHTNVTYTKVPYILDGPFTIDENEVSIENISIKDSQGNGGTINGKYFLAGEDKKKIDLLFDLKNVHGLNTTFQDAAQGFWGNSNATGKLRIFGPLNGLRFNIDIATEGGEIHVPLDERHKVSKRDILTFVNRHNTAQTAYDSIISIRNIGKSNVRRKGGVKTNIKMKVGPTTNLVVDINRAAGDRATVKGNGQVEMRTGEGQFDIRGSYVVNEGLCHFTILGITAKDFIIQEGGVVNFVGPVMESDFKLAGAYQTKASIETLFGDTKSVSTRRTVNCIVNLTGKIDNPKIGFKIEVPDLDPSYKGMLESALSTEEKNLRQGLALLVSGGFIPDQQSGIVNNTTFLYSNASEIVSNQISNIFHQLNIPIDLGLKYQPGTSGVDIFDVAISTQLFNNRVTINGSIGNKEYSTSGSNSDIIGNIDVGIKINKTGQLKVNVFSHAADQYSNYLDQSQRNGAGITYQEEFATFKELWQLIFKPKQKQADR